MWIIQVLEISKNSKRTGKWRLTARSNEDGGGPWGLCNHEHNSINEAQQCLEAWEKAKKF